MTAENSISRFATEANKSRRLFFKSLEPFPRSLKQVVKGNYRKRLLRSHGKPMLGECAPWLLADMLNVKNRRAIESVIPSWMNLYAFTIFIDDVLDRGHETEFAPLLLATNLLLERGISSLYGLPRSKKVRIRLDSFFIETAAAAMEEILRHKNRLSNFSSSDVDRIGQKVAFLKLCAAEILAADGRALAPDLFISVEYLATGMQLLDDITDWEEDWRSKTYSHLLTKTFSRLRKMGSKKALDPQSFSKDQVFVAVVVTGALEDCIERALFYLQHIVDGNEYKTQRAQQILKAIIEENGLFLIEVRSTRLACKSFVGDDILADHWLQRITSNKKTKRKFDSIKRKLIVIATNS